MDIKSFLDAVESECPYPPRDDTSPLKYTCLPSSSKEGDDEDDEDDEKRGTEDGSPTNGVTMDNVPFRSTPERSGFIGECREYAVALFSARS